MDYLSLFCIINKKYGTINCVVVHFNFVLFSGVDLFFFGRIFANVSPYKFLTYFLNRLLQLRLNILFEKENDYFLYYINFLPYLIKYAIKFL